ncbi:MAG: hypothetical protein LKI17_00080 [Megasphaera cerevisiae]|jgi:hypothetical protein|nr:hypothetical protein [Megasphaera cerevisiae]
MLHDEVVQMQRVLLFLTIMFLPFMVVPNIPFSHSLITYPLMLGIMVFLWDMKREHTFHTIPRLYIGFISVFFIWSVICMMHGIYMYPFYTTVNMGQSDKLTALILWLSSHQIDIHQEIILKIWLLLRFIKDIFFNVLLTFGGSLWIYSLYHENWKRGFVDVRNGMLGLTILLCLYSIIEIGYLMGNDTATYILKIINPLYMDIQGDHAWWPPLLWNGQLRSLFPEPSFFGIVAAVIVPFVCSFLLKTSNIKVYIIYIFYIIMLFLTRARTATGLFLGEMGLLTFSLFVYCQGYGKKILSILICSIIAFFISVTIFLPSGNNTKILEISESYTKNSIISVYGNQRSNIARKVNVMATTLVGIEHPVFGVGKGLKDAYLVQYLSDEALKNYEVQLWFRMMEEKGILKSGFPTLNKLSTVLAESGVIGCILYVLPFLYVIIKVFRKSVLKHNPEIICLVIALIGSMVAFFSNAEFWSIYIVLGLLLCVIDGESHEM